MCLLSKTEYIVARCTLF